MKSDPVLHLFIQAQPGSVLETTIQKFIEDREKMRKELQQEYNRQVQKQIKKLERSGL